MYRFFLIPDNIPNFAARKICLINNNRMKKILTILIVFALMGLSVSAQTNFSGGIYSDTTWTLANSPYILTDTVVVFPGVTLTIQPGVVVKFDTNVQLEIRQATLIANGTNSDSITFTSNSSTPFPGIWSGILQNACNGQFNYCNFHYANRGIFCNDPYYSMTIKNSSFSYNLKGLNGLSFIDSTNVNYNTRYGLSIWGGSITNSNILNNGVGVASGGGMSIIQNCIVSHNDTGMFVASVSINDCKINNNGTGVIAESAQSSGGYFLLSNCIIDSNSVIGIINNADDGPLTDSIYNCQINNNGIGLLLPNCCGYQYISKKQY